MMRTRLARTLAAVVVFVAMSGLTTLGQAQGTIPSEAQRLECERSGGYWASASGYCKIGG